VFFFAAWFVFICHSSFYSSFSFVILRYVFFSPHLLLSSELFVNAR
jgi:hypothetical protein